MTYAPYIFNDFSGGLNLAAKADLVGANECVDCRDVVFDDGAIRCRPGLDEFTTADTTNQILSVYGPQVSSHVLAGCGTRLEAIDIGTGTVSASATGKTSAGDGGWYWGFTDYGTATTPYTFAGNGENILQTWNGSAWGTVANSPKAAALCVTPSSNRLVATRFKTTTGGPSGGASTSSPSHVYFSEAGDPTSWPTSNYVQIDPNDGDVIMGCVTWRDYVFVFKEHRFYVFTEESTDADGNPVFNYRKVDTGIGLIAPRALAVHESGVYFIDRNGLYVTTGDTPTKVSGAMDVAFLGLDTDFFTSRSITTGTGIDRSLVIWQDLVIFTAVNTAGGRTTFVYNINDGWWTTWVPRYSPEAWTIYDNDGAYPRLFFCSISTDNTKKVFEISHSYTDDDGVAISGYYTTGFTDLGIAENKRLRQIKLWGTGTSVTLTGYSDLDVSTAGSTGSITLNTYAGPEVNVGIQRVGFRGTTFAFKITNIGGGESVHRIEPHIAGTRQPTVTQTEKT